jgi:hypothetical protein
MCRPWSQCHETAVACFRAAFTCSKFFLIVGFPKIECLFRKTVYLYRGSPLPWSQVPVYSLQVTHPWITATFKYQCSLSYRHEIEKIDFTLLCFTQKCPKQMTLNFYRFNTQSVNVRDWKIAWLQGLRELKQKKKLAKSMIWSPSITSFPHRIV